MTLTTSLSAAALARTTVWLVWLNMAALLASVLFLTAEDRGGGAWIASAFALAFLGLPGWRYATWLGRLGRGTATDVDARRVRAWLRFYRVLAMLGLLGAGVAVWAGLRPLGSPPTPDTLEAALLFLLAGVSIRMLGDVRNWVGRLTAAQQTAPVSSVDALVRSATPWVRAVQLSSGLYEVAWLARQGEGNLFVSVDSLIATVLTILILEFSLCFAWATAREDAPAQPQGQPLL